MASPNMTTPTWLSETDLARISAQNPSTDWGRQLFRDVWPQRFPTVLASDTYRAYASVLSRIHTSMRKGMTLAEIEVLIDREDRIYRNLQPGTVFTGGAGLAVTNALQNAHSVHASLFADTLESELIYAARMYMTARGMEGGGRKLA
jgi:hypothetical protein